MNVSSCSFHALLYFVDTEAALTIFTFKSVYTRTQYSPLISAYIFSRELKQ